MGMTSALLNPPVGFDPVWPQGSTGSFNASQRGEHGFGDEDHPGPASRRPVASPLAVKSSTTKGPQGLAGERQGRRCRTVNAPIRSVRQSFCILLPESPQASASG